MSNSVMGGALLDFFSKTLSNMFRKTFSGWGDPIDQSEVEEDGFKGTKYVYDTQTNDGNKCKLEITLFAAADSKSAYIVRCSHDGGKDSETSNAVRVAKQSGDSEEAIAGEVSEYVEAYCEKHNIVCEISDDLSKNPTKDIKVVTTKRNTLNIREEFVNMNGVILTFSHDEGQDEETYDEVDVSEELDCWLQYCHEHDLGVPRARGLDKEGRDTYYKNSNYFKEVCPEGKEDVFLSSKISVTLKKVTASDHSTDIHLCAINAGGNPVRAMKVLADVLDDDEFVDAITEEPVSFEITETASDYDVEEATGVDTSETFREMLRACVECYHNLQAIHWGAKTSKFRDIHSFVESLIWSIQYNVDTIAEWCVEYTKSVPNVLEFSYTPLQVADGFDFGSAMSAAKAQIDNYIAVLECYYVNVEHDVQSVMDNWIRDLKKQSNYVLDRSLITESCDC